jgi:hypothetical protein
MFNLNKFMLAGSLGLGAAALSGSVSLAAVVCNDDGDCWHSREIFSYPAEGHVVIRPDEWAWKSDEHYKWHEHEGRGYWAHGEWRTF